VGASSRIKGYVKMHSEDMSSRCDAEATGWRDHIKVHRDAKLFEKISDAERQRLGLDIKEHGIRNKITLYYAGKEPAYDIVGTPGWWRKPSHLAKTAVLDGQNRMDAGEQFAGIDWMQDCGRDFTVVFKYKRINHNVNNAPQHEENDFDTRAFVLSANLHRRDLDPEAIRKLVAGAIKADPSKSDRAIAEDTGSNRNTVGRERAAIEAAGEVSRRDTIVGKNGVEQPARKGKPEPAARPQPTTLPESVRSADDAEAYRRADLFNNAQQAIRALDDDIVPLFFKSALASDDGDLSWRGIREKVDDLESSVIVKFLIARMKKIHDEHWSEFWDACVAEDERRTALVLPATVDSPTGSPTALTPPSEPEPANDAPSLIDDYQALSLEQQVAAYAWIMAGRREKDPDQDDVGRDFIVNTYRPAPVADQKKLHVYFLGIKNPREEFRTQRAA